MQTTLRLNDNLMRQAKAQAAEEGITVTRLIEHAVRYRLRAKVSDGNRIKLPTLRLRLKNEKEHLTFERNEEIWEILDGAGPRRS